MALEKGVNSYCTAEEAVELLQDMLDAEAFLDASPTRQAQALLEGARRIEEFSAYFIGMRTAATQPLSWPRNGATDATGTAIAKNTVPAAIIEAQCREALAELEWRANGGRDRELMQQMGVTQIDANGPKEVYGTVHKHLGTFRSPRAAELIGVFLHRNMSTLVNVGW